MKEEEIIELLTNKVESIKEEEIIELLTNKVESWNKSRPCYANSDLIWEIDDENKAIQSLLDLYKQEKEKNRQSKMRIVQLENEITARIEDLNNDYISKDKIRELAKKYEYAGNGYDCTTASYEESQDIGRYIAYLELLEEE